jgi:hypothetical protein
LRSSSRLQAGARLVSLSHPGAQRFRYDFSLQAPASPPDHDVCNVATV